MLSRLFPALLLAASCRSAGALHQTPRQGRSEEVDRIAVAWNPTTGKGAVSHHFASGDRIDTCFQCGYPGYTGGLVIGSFNDSGLAFVPRVPVRGYDSINVLCATDESIWDLDERAEYAFGWSENFGRGDDGKPLGYVRGAVLEPGPDRAVLFSENAGGCYQVEKVATTRAAARWWIIATRITNRCALPVHFDFFTGDDPWLGRYRSSDGDVGWSPDGIIERETGLSPFTEGGIYDLGNRALGQDPGPFSNQADFFAVDPASPLPDRAFVANRFAHQQGDIDPGHALTNAQMIALNLGWTGRTLQPGASFTVALAQGLAQTFEPGAVPRAPEISDADWSVWRQHLTEPGDSVALEFAAEEVTLTLSDGQLTVDGRYHLLNPGAGAGTVGITYPVWSDAQQPAPAAVQVDGRETAVELTSEGPAARFAVPIFPRGLSSFRVSYLQALGGRRATYRVTSARSWPDPITRAIFEIRRPARLERATVSFPVASSRQVGDTRIDRIVERDFRPDRELVIEW